MLCLAFNLARRAARAAVLLLLVLVATLALVRYAPGYFADARELDGAFASTVRTELAARAAEEHSVAQMARSLLAGFAHGDLGTSRHYHVPVSSLLAPCLPVSGKLLACSLPLAWGAAFVVALPASLLRHRLASPALALASAAVLAVPIGALATVMVVTGHGGPTLALAAALAARDFPFLLRVLAAAARSPHLVFARAQGMGTPRLLLTHLLRPVLPRCLSLLGLSLLAGLSLLVPAEVLFDLPGVGQLAWTAAMNRDTAVLLPTTLLMAAAVLLVRLLSPSSDAPLLLPRAAAAPAGAADV